MPGLFIYQSGILLKNLVIARTNSVLQLVDGLRIEQVILASVAPLVLTPDPQHVAAVLAEIMGGKAVPFPPNPGSHFALQLDDHGSGVEVYPAGTELRPGSEVGGGFVRKEPRGFGPTHFALSVTTSADTVKAIAKREGWHCFDCSRGPFHVIEVWVEKEQMIEVLPPEYAAEYLAWTQPADLASRMAAAPVRPERLAPET